MGSLSFPTKTLHPLSLDTKFVCRTIWLWIRSFILSITQKGYATQYISFGSQVPTRALNLLTLQHGHSVSLQRGDAALDRAPSQLWTHSRDWRCTSTDVEVGGVWLLRLTAPMKCEKRTLTVQSATATAARTSHSPGRPHGPLRYTRLTNM